VLRGKADGTHFAVKLHKAPGPRKGLEGREAVRPRSRPDGTPGKPGFFAGYRKKMRPNSEIIEIANRPEGIQAAICPQSRR
jgi:hypothetical protein